MAGALDFARRVYGGVKRRIAPVEVPEPEPEPEPVVDDFPIDAWCQDSYPAWFEAHKVGEEELEQQRASYKDLSEQPLFSIIVPLYKTPSEYLHTVVDSVLAQSYPNLQLILVNASPELAELAQEVAAYAQQDERIEVVTLPKNLGITENTNYGLAAAKGDFCCFVDHDDFIEPDTLFEYARALSNDPQIDVLYCDEELVEKDAETGEFVHLHPLFKSAYSPEYLLCKNYIVHLMCVRTTLIQQMEKPDSRYDGTQDYNMVLFATHHARKVHNVERVLYHWRVSESSTAANPEAKPYGRRAYRLSVQNELDRRQARASIVASGIANIHNIWFDMPNELVSLVVDSSSKERIQLFEELFAQANLCQTIELVYTNPEVSDNKFARLNEAASRATGTYLIFLDDGCMPTSPDFIGQLVGLCALDGIAAASPKTLYSNGRNKTFGIAITRECIMPMYRGYEDDFPGYQCNLRAFQNVSAAGLQGLCVSRALFEELGGFTTTYSSEVGSADFCVRLRDTGQRIVVTPTAKLVVEELCPDEKFDCSANAADFTQSDIMMFDEAHPGLREQGDPYLNSNFNQSSSYCQI